MVNCFLYESRENIVHFFQRTHGGLNDLKLLSDPILLKLFTSFVTGNSSLYIF